MREGPLRRVEPAGEPGLRQRLGAKAWTTGRRLLSLRGQQDRGVGEEGFGADQAADGAQVGGREADYYVRWRCVYVSMSSHRT